MWVKGPSALFMCWGHLSPSSSLSLALSRSLDAPIEVSLGTSLAVQWLRLCAPSAGGMGSIPGHETEISHAMQHGQKPKKKSKSNLLSGTWVMNAAVIRNSLMTSVLASLNRRLAYSLVHFSWWALTCPTHTRWWWWYVELLLWPFQKIHAGHSSLGPDIIGMSSGF